MTSKQPTNDKININFTIKDVKKWLLENEQKKIDKDKSNPNASTNDKHFENNESVTRLPSGFSISTDAINNANINTEKLNEILIKNYGETDIVLSDELKEVFKILTKREKIKQYMKISFFIVIMVIFCILTIAPLLLFAFMYDKMTDLSFLVSIIGSLIELTVGIIILPRIIAQYLFDKDEDKMYYDLIKELKAYHDSKKDKF